MDYMSFFSKTYEDSRTSFLETVNNHKSPWHHVHTWTCEIKESLHIDFARFDSPVKQNLLCLTCGLHGIEGYVGAAVLKYFLERFNQSLSCDNTTLILVHAINPYGMEKFERENENNVDLNRNFLRSWDAPPINHEYTEAKGYFESNSVLVEPFLNKVDFFFTTLGQLIRTKPEPLKQALLNGQYSSPDGLFYGGSGYEKSTNVMIELFNGLFKEEFHNMVFVDMHTGYGPKDKLTILNSALEKRTCEKLKESLSYPDIKKTNKEDFYSINGNMTDYIYHLKRLLAPEKELFACGFEFGTLGDDLIGLLKSLRHVINSRKLKKGLCSPQFVDTYRAEYKQMFYPSDHLWRVEALKQSERAMKSILKAFNLLKK